MREQFIYFWEILTGVQTESPAKLIRAVCLAVLLGGTAWSIYSYFNALNLSDTSYDVNNIPRRPSSSNTQELDRALSAAQNVNAMRGDAERLASQMTVMNKKLFTENPMAVPGLDTEEYAPASEPVQKEALPAVDVKAVMFRGNTRVAVVSVGDRRKNQGLMVQNGFNLPENAGKVVDIGTDGITVVVSGEEFGYRIKSADATEDSYIVIRKASGGSPIM